jgi:hypothetical protein
VKFCERLSPWLPEGEATPFLTQGVQVVSALGPPACVVCWDPLNAWVGPAASQQGDRGDPWAMQARRPHGEQPTDKCAVGGLVEASAYQIEACPAWCCHATTNTATMIREAIARSVNGCVGRCDPPPA